MPILILRFLIAACLFSFSCSQTRKEANQPAKKTVDVVLVNGTYQLYRNGEPYFIKGATGDQLFEKIKEHGGNSVRTWNTQNAQQILDRAHQLGLTVTLGLDVLYPEGGFRPSASSKTLDYRNEAKVQHQLEALEAEIVKYKDHPALLMWGIGNELSIKIKPYAILDQIRLWRAVDDIGAMIHRVDPNHPTTTMLPGFPRLSIWLLATLGNEIDVLSFNIFRIRDNFQERVRRWGWAKPFIASEIGSQGYWSELPATDWGAIPELTSTEKAAYIQELYTSIIPLKNQTCLGTYAFIWGQKNEYTPTWFSLFTKAGQETEVIDAIHYLWKNTWPSNRAPSVHALTLNGEKAADNIYLYPDSAYVATFAAKDPENGWVAVYWEILKDERDFYLDHRFNQERFERMASDSLRLSPQPFPIQFSSGSPPAPQHTVTFSSPAAEGPYRLYLYLYDEQDKVSTANIPFYVYAQDYTQYITR